MPKGDKLTAKQERFCLNIFQGMSQREAYVNAGYSTKQSDASIHVRACELAKDSKIVVRLNELKKEAKKKAILTVDERKEICSKGAKGELVDKTITTFEDGKQIITERTSARGPYIAELNKMERIGSHEGDVSINVLIQRIVNNLTVNNISVEQLSDDELRLLSSGDNNP